MGNILLSLSLSRRLSLSGVQVNEDLPSFEVGPTLNRTAVAGGDSASESAFSPLHTHYDLCDISLLNFGATSN